jgi:hypothetical protein
MNIGMTVLQNQLAEQRTPLSSQQAEAVKQHPTEGRLMLERLMVRDRSGWTPCNTTMWCCSPRRWHSCSRWSVWCAFWAR